MNIMEKISKSNDEVSAVLTTLFAQAVPHQENELERARQRKERGQPPGKRSDPIGDQLTWEQILTQFVGKTKLWIITRDSDYGTIYEGTGFFNQFLYEELRKVSHDAEAFLFGDVASGIKHFAEITGVSADKLPSPEEIEENKKELQAIHYSLSGDTGSFTLTGNIAATAGTAIGIIASPPSQGIAVVAKAGAADIGSTSRMGIAPAVAKAGP
jgi:hypothetical protein